MTYTREDLEREMLAEMAERAPVIAWAEFQEWFEWEQGEHVAIIGPTGSGKSHLSIELVQLRSYVVAFATKPKDETMDRLLDLPGFRRYKKWTDRPARVFPRRVLWPDSENLYSQGLQQKEFRTALEHIYRQGRWCVYFDELWYLINILKLDVEVKTFLLQARSMYISMLACSQRPAWVPVEVFDQSSWLFFFRDNDERNLKTIAGISWLSAKMVQGMVARLGEFEFLGINTRTGAMIRSKAPPPGEEG